MTKAPPAPLEARDAERAQVLKQKVLHRLADVARHHAALLAAMAEFGEDFDLEPFARAHRTDDPTELNRIKAVERGVDQLYNYVAAVVARPGARDGAEPGGRAERPPRPGGDG
ncbi:MAG TPA: hypothetical protein VF517_07585 [Thermoleophilaceae bacterium]